MAKLSFTGHAGNSNWNGTLTGDNDGGLFFSNWTGDAVPGAGDDLTIGQGWNVLIDSVDVHGQPDSADSLTVAQGASLEIRGGGSNTLGPGTTNNGYALINKGTINIDETAFGASNLIVAGNVSNNSQINISGDGHEAILAFHGTVALTGKGALNLTPNADPNAYNIADITGDGAGATLENYSTIQGGSNGYIGNQAGSGGFNHGSALILHNHGIINASSTTLGMTISMGFASTNPQNAITNDGTIESTTGTGLFINAGGAATEMIVQSSAGVLGAFGTGAHLELSNIIVQGGNLASNGGGTIHLSGNSDVLDGSSPAGAVALSNRAVVTAFSLESFVIKGSIVNAGTIALTGGGFNAVMRADLGGATLSGGGTVHLGGAGEISGVSTSQVATLINMDNVIDGSGIIGAAWGNPYGDNTLLALDNRGVINANSASGGLTIQFAYPSASAPVHNSGTMQSTAAGGLLIEGTTVEQSGAGKIGAFGAGAHVEIHNSTIRGGLIASNNGGIVHVAASVLDGHLASAPLAIAAGSTVVSYALEDFTVLGAINNAGTIDLEGSGWSAVMRVALNGAKFDGGGTIHLGPGGSVEISGVSDSQAGLLNNIGDTIDGAGTIGAHWGHPYGDNTLMTLKNQVRGTIDANVAGQTLLIETHATVANDGTLEADGGHLQVNDAVTGKGVALLKHGGSIDFTSAYSGDIAFDGVSGERINLAQSFSGKISGIDLGDTIDLRAFGFNGNYVLASSIAGGDTTLNVLDAANGNALVTSFLVHGLYDASEFGLANDGGGGTLLSGVLDHPVFTGGDDSATLHVAGHSWKALGGNDSVTGTAGTDTINGGVGDDALMGGAGNDNLSGGNDDDTLDGGAGIDHLTGGTGNDTFVFHAGEANRDRVADFTGNGADPGDRLQFVGFGSDATFTQTDLTHWRITYDHGAAHEDIVFANAPAIDPTDYVFL